MITFPIDNIFIEGPDCSGKTSLIRSIHKSSGYRWHLMDRSQFSRSIFASLYKRKVALINESLKKEIYNLNNITFVLLPTWDEIERRFHLRGDEIHDIESLRSVYNRFLSHSSGFVGYPHFHFPSIRDLESTEKTSEFVIRALKSRESVEMSHIAYMIKKFALSSPRNEAAGLQFSLYEDGNFESVNPEILNLESEKDYYGLIFNSTLSKISDEIDGKNEYSKKQNISSRRFIHTNDSCISLIHSICRDGTLDIHMVLRSTDVEEKLYHDLEFLYYLCSQITKKLRSIGKINSIKMRFCFNSAHILKTVNPAC
jgi:hypothetical protein